MQGSSISSPDTYDSSSSSSTTSVSDMLQLDDRDKVIVSERNSMCSTVNYPTWWDSCGGLPGFLLSLNDISEPGETGEASPFVLHGPSEVHQFLSSMRHFTYHTNVNLTVQGYTSAEAPVFVDENICVTPVVVSLVKNSFKKRKHENINRGTNARPLKEDRANTSPHWYSHVSNDTSFVVENAMYNTPAPLEPDKPELFISYIVQSHPTPGKFDAAKAKSLGITKGLDCGRLARGEPVTLENGKTVYPKEVIGPSIPGSSFFIIHCPNELVIDLVIENHKWTNAPKPVCVIHSVTPEVYKNPRYQSWISSFPSEVSHLIASTEVNEVINYPRSAVAIATLNLLDSKVFPLGFNCYEVKNVQKNNRIAFAKPKLRFTFGKKTGIDDSEVGVSIEELKDKILKEKPDYKSFVEEAQKYVSDKPKAPSFAGSDIQICTLGTGSAMPSLYRNVSSTYVRIPVDKKCMEDSAISMKNILLDCGEGTLGRLSRQYGDNLKYEIASLRWIYISHMHADHHAGVIGVLKAWTKYSDGRSKLFITAPPQFEFWLLEYSRIDYLPLSNIVFISNSALRTDRKPSALESSRLSSLFKEFDLVSFRTVPAIHCPYSYCMEITNSSGWKIAYSGDTRPSEDFANIAKDSTLLIHEATLEDSMHEIAIKKQHSTYSEALEVAKKAGTKNVILTHFSQRYPKLPDIDISTEDLHIALAFDGMTLKISDISMFRYFGKPLAYLFNEENLKEESDPLKF
ncbi:Ribonuclease Z [Schizosaccharomyces pombe]